MTRLLSAAFLGAVLLVGGAGPALADTVPAQLMIHASVSARGDATAKLSANFATAEHSTAWSACSSFAPDSMPYTTLIDALVCYGKTDPQAACDILAGMEWRLVDDFPTPDFSAVGGLSTSQLQAKINFDESAWHNASAKRDTWAPIIRLAEMKIAASAGYLSLAAYAGRDAITLQHKWNGGLLPEEEPVYYGMLTPDMKKILLAHGGTMNDNRSARPQEWKENGPGGDLWVYQSGGAVVTTYVFTNGNLTDTLKP